MGGVFQRFSPPEGHEKAGKFLARVGRATVIQMKLTYSSVGPLYCTVTSAVAREYLNDCIFSSSSRRLRAMLLPETQPIVCQ